MSPFGKLKNLFGKKPDKRAEVEDTIALREGTAEFEFFVASEELDHGEDLGHGISHLANLLSFDPGRSEWLELLEAYSQRAGGDLLAILPGQGQQAYFAVEALRAWALARSGQLEQAVDLMNAIHQARPQADYLESWMLGWLEPAGAFESLEPTTALHFLAGVLNMYPENKLATVAQGAALQRLAALAGRLDAKRLDLDLVPMLHMTAAGLCRKAGFFEQGLGIIRALADQASTWHTAVAEGLLMREAGQVEAAQFAFEQALAVDPTDLAARLETGDMYFELGAWEQAAGWYQQVLDRQPDHPWAKASWLYCGWMQSDASSPPEELIAMSQSEDGARAWHLFDRHRPFDGFWPEPQDATVNLLRQLIEQLEQSDGDGGGSVAVTLSDLEAPSNQVAFDLAMRSLGREIQLDLTIQHFASPDPREPIEPIAHTLWLPDGDLLLPALPEPPAEVCDAVAGLASAPYEPQANWALASRIGPALGPDKAESLLACAVHPPLPPSGQAADVPGWVARFQLAVAQIAAHLDAGWEDSARRRALYALLLGPRDWTTNAAIAAVARLTADEPALFLDVHEAFGKLDAARPDSGDTCYERTLCTYWLRLSGLWPQEQEQLEARLEALDAQNE